LIEDVVAGGHTMKGTKVCLVFPLFVGMAFALSFQGQEEVKSNMILANEAIQHQKPQEDSTESVSDKQDLITKRGEMRRMRLYVLGAVTEQLVAWFLKDIIPTSIMQRTKRSLNVPGKI
jgi:hypothetical protein